VKCAQAIKPMHETATIEKFFCRSPIRDKKVVIGIGDDATVLNIPREQQLVMSMDTLNMGVHFPEQTSAFDLGFKAAAVNLSDLAAMAATPKWMTLSLSLPQIESQWLTEFGDGLFAMLEQHQVSLIGGDLNRGKLSVTLQAHGLVPRGSAILRSNAQVGDLLYVSGVLGDAALALQALQKKTQLSPVALSQLLPALTRPQPQVSLGVGLRGLATAMIDISDGLSSDLPRLLMASDCGAEIDLQSLPLSKTMQNSMPSEVAKQFAFVGGDDYQLCFTAPTAAEASVARISEQLHVPLTQIGVINNSKELKLQNTSQSYSMLHAKAFQHFKP